MTEKQAEQKAQHDSHAKPREVLPGQRVMVRNIRAGQAWLPGTVIERTEPLSYMCKLVKSAWKRHIDHIWEIGDTLEVQERPDMAQTMNRPRVHEPEESARQETAPEELN